MKLPNIISLLGYAATLKELVLVMNLVEGSTLHTLILSREKIKVKTNLPYKLYSIYVTTDTCSTEGIYSKRNCCWYHDPIIIHQDIKPLNVMVF